MRRIIKTSKKKSLTVLSLFDGISCGRVALDRAVIPIATYLASEIDKYATTIAAKNYPDTIHLGDITNWRQWKIPKPDIIIGGSPCQGFSIAGKQLNFDDPRSKLFFVYVDILKHYSPTYFLLENVPMKKDYADVITSMLNVSPIEINSALVSAQNRRRLYWTNIPDISQPVDKGIYLGDIIEDAVTERTKAHCIDANYAKGGTLRDYLLKRRRQLVFNMKYSKDSSTLDRMLKNIRGMDEKSFCLSASMFKDMASNGCTNVVVNDLCRMLTPVECERLQTLPDNYTEGISKTQRYKTIGNGWTVDVIAHIFRHIPL